MLLINNPAKQEKVGFSMISGKLVMFAGYPILTFLLKYLLVSSFILLRLAPPPHKIIVSISLVIDKTETLF